MSHKKQKKQQKKTNSHVPSQQPSGRVRRVRLVDGWYVFFTVLIILASVTGMLVMQFRGWFDTIPGAILSVLVAGIGVMCFFDLSLLLTNAITLADGTIRAGKNAQGDIMIFHAQNVERVELRNAQGAVVPENQTRYRRVAVTFVMASGRVNQRPMGRIKQKKLEQIRQLVAIGKKENG